MAGLHIGGAYISMGLGPRNAEGRTQYGCFIDLPDGTSHEVNDLSSGCQGGALQEGFVSLLSFLGAAGEGRGFEMRNPGMTSECHGLFLSEEVTEWAYQHSDEIGMLCCEIEETSNLIEP